MTVSFPEATKPPSDDQIPLWKKGREISWTLDMRDVPREVVHLVVGCPRDYPHEGMECLYSNIILGEE